MNEFHRLSVVIARSAAEYVAHCESRIGKPRMASAKKVAIRLMQRAFASRGLMLVKPRERFGIDIWGDIRRLAADWAYPIEAILDVGANDGAMAAAALAAFPEARVIGFEPHPATFERLCKGMAGETRFTGENIALGRETGEVSMFMYDTSTINSLVPDAPFAVRFDQRSTEIKVACTTLDAYCAAKGIDAVDVLKIDTEGFDASVLDGARTLLQRHAIKFVELEFNDIHPKSGTTGGSLAHLDAILRPYGFRFIASYNDYVVTTGEFFSVSNALFALPPEAACRRDG